MSKIAGKKGKIQNDLPRIYTQKLHDDRCRNQRALPGRLPTSWQHHYVCEVERHDVESCGVGDGDCDEDRHKEGELRIKKLLDKIQKSNEQKRKFAKMNNEELANALLFDVWGNLELYTTESNLIGVVIERLREHSKYWQQETGAINENINSL